MITSTARVYPFGTTFAERGAALLGVLIGLGLALLRSRSGTVDGPWDPVAFGFVYGLPGFLALAGRRRRPSLYLAAGVIGPLLSFTALSGIALPMMIPAGMALVAYGRRAGEARGILPDPAVAFICLVLTAGSFLTLFVHQDSRCVSTATSTSCTSDVLTLAEAAIATVGVALTVFAGWALSRPRKHD
jgi:hypothetical protein